MSILTFICYGQNSQNFPGPVTENPISGTEKAPECPFFGTSRSLKLTEKFSLCLTLFLNTGREADCERPLYIRCLLCGCLPDLKLIFVQYRRKNAAKYLTGNHLSDSYRHHHNRDRQCHAVCIAEHKRHDADIRDDRWKCRNKMPAAAAIKSLDVLLQILFLSFFYLTQLTYLWIVAFTAPDPAIISRNIFSIFSPTPSL